MIGWAEEACLTDRYFLRPLLFVHLYWSAISLLQIPLRLHGHQMCGCVLAMPNVVDQLYLLDSGSHSDLAQVPVYVPRHST